MGSSPDSQGHEMLSCLFKYDSLSYQTHFSHSVFLLLKILSNEFLIKKKKDRIHGQNYLLAL